MPREFKLAWLDALKKQKGKDPLGTIAALLDDDDTVEQAMIELEARIPEYPRAVAQQLVFKMIRGGNVMRLGVRRLLKVPEKDRNAAFRAVAQTYKQDDPRKWERHVQKVKKELRATTTP